MSGQLANPKKIATTLPLKSFIVFSSPLCEVNSKYESNLASVKFDPLKIKLLSEQDNKVDNSSKITKNLFIYNFLKVDFHFIMLTKSHSGYPWIRQRSLKGHYGNTTDNERS
jgi:hypothetical protein